MKLTNGYGRNLPEKEKLGQGVYGAELDFAGVSVCVGGGGGGGVHND